MERESRGCWICYLTQKGSHRWMCVLYTDEHLNGEPTKQETFHYPFHDFFFFVPAGFSLFPHRINGNFQRSRAVRSIEMSVRELSVRRESAFRTVQSQAYSIPDCPIQFIKSIWVSAGPAFPVSGRYKLYVSQRWYSSCKRHKSFNICNFFLKKETFVDKIYCIFEQVNLINNAKKYLGHISPIIKVRNYILHE